MDVAKTFPVMIGVVEKTVGDVSVVSHHVSVDRRLFREALLMWKNDPECSSPYKCAAVFSPA